MSLSTSFPLASRQWQRQFLVSPRRLPRRSCAYSVHACWAKFWDSSLVSSEKKKRRRFLLPQERVRRLFFSTNGITPFMEVLIITPRPRTLFRTKSPWFHLGNDATPAGRGLYRRRDLVRLDRTKNPSKSELSHFFENDNKWIRLQHHVFSPLEQKNKCCRGLGTKLHF